MWVSFILFHNTKEGITKSSVWKKDVLDLVGQETQL